MVHRRLTRLVEALREGGGRMNYEIQQRHPKSHKWFYWSTTDPRIKDRKRHIELLRKTHRNLKFRIVRVTRKVVNG